MNNVNLIGRITRNHELKVTGTQQYVLNFTLAVNRRASKGEEAQADFITCIAWNRTAEVLNKYTSKGSLVGISGRVSTRNYQNKEGKKVYLTEIIVEEVNLLDKKKDPNTYVEQQNPYDGFDTGASVNIDADDLPY